MKSLKSLKVVALSIGMMFTTASMTVEAKTDWLKIAGYTAGAAVVAAGGYGIYKSATNKPNQLYCNANDHLMHIFHDTDRVFVDASGKTVPCNPNVQQ